MQMQQIQSSHFQASPQKDEASEHALSNALRELGEQENKSVLVTENPQRTVENASRVQKDSVNNTLLANSELLQMPVQHYVQQQAPLRLSTPVIANRQPNFINVPPQNQVQAVQSQSQALRASLPGNTLNQNINQGLAQHFSGWVPQPATTQGRVQTGVFEFPAQNQQIQGQPRIPINMQPNVNQNRPSSASPQRFVFNYQSNQKNPQPQPKPQPPPVVVPPQPSPPVIIHPVQPAPIPHSNSAAFILPQHNQQTIIWQQRYFIILEKFQYYYTRIEIIHKKCIYLDQAIMQTKKTEQLQLLKAESEQLLLIITQTEQELTQTMHRNRELLTQATNWKQKYEELAKAFEALRQTQSATNQELTNRVQFLNKQLAQLQANYQQINKKNAEQMTKNSKLQKEVVALNSQIKQLRERPTLPSNYQEFQLQYKEMSKIIEEKNVIIINLKKALEEKDHSGQNIPQSTDDVLNRQIRRLEEELTSKNNIITQLQEENTKMRETHKSQVNKYVLTIQQYKRSVAQYEQTITIHKTEIKKYQTLIETKNQEINSISKQSNSSQGTPRNSQLQIENRRLKHELTVYEESHASDIKILNGKIQELLDKVKMISNERDSTVGTLQEKSTLLESDINRKDGTIRNLRDRILQLQQQKRIRDLDKKYEPKKSADYTQSQEIMNLRRQLSDKAIEIEQLQAQLTQYKRITNEYEDSLRVKKHQINALKRELQQKSENVSNSSQLNQQIVKKNAQLVELRNKVVQQQKIANQNQVLRQENSHLTESLRKKHNELTEATDKIYFLEKKIRELETVSDKSPKLVHLSQEIELLQIANAKKDQQISKLRQNNQLLQSNIDELELQLQRIKNRFNTGEKNSENERGELKSKLSVLQLKVIEYQRKISGLQEVRTIMTEQINTLTTQIHIKYENQQRVQLELKQQRAKIKNLEAELESQLIETEEVRNKLKEWQKKYQNLNKELQAEFEKKKDLSNTKKNELFNLNNKYIELQNTLKGKDSKIKQLQKTVDSLNTKIRTFDHNLEEIQYLKHKISEYEYKISIQNHRFVTTRLPDLQPTQVFQRKVIYQLKMQNQALRRQLGLAPKPDGKQANIPERDTNNSSNVNQRLNDFHKKLQQVISQNLVIDYNITGDELFRRMQRDRRLLIEKHNQQITQLKVRILELEGHNTSNNLPKKYTNINQIFNEQLDFYREKNLQLEQRVENHIKVNRQLKESIEILLKTQSGETSLSYYKQQLEKANDTIVNLQKQLKKVNDQLRKLKEDTSKINNKSLIESNVIQTESKVVELTRKISQLTLQISLLQKDRLSKEETVTRSEQEIKRYKLLIEQLKSSKDELLRNLKEKQIAYQDEITKITNKLRISQAEIQRLNSVITSRQDQDSTESKNLRMRIAELQEDNKKLRTRVEQLIISQQKYQREIAKQQNKAQNLISEMQRLKQIADGVGKKHREGDAELQSLRVTISEYESRIKSYQSLRESFTYKENQFQQEILRLQNQCKLFQAQIERMTEFTQKKVSERDVEINRLKALLKEKTQQNSQLQDQIRQMKVLSFKSNQAAQEIFALKQQISNLKVIQSLKITESDNRLREIYELNDKLVFNQEQSIQMKRAFEAKINELQGIISNLQIQLSQGNSGKEQEISALKRKISILQSQKEQMRLNYERQITEIRSINYTLQQKITEFTNENNNLKEKYQIISSQYQQLTVNFQNSETTIIQLRLQIIHLQEQLSNMRSNLTANNKSIQVINASRYTIEYLRSTLIQIDTLLNQEGTVRFEILQQVEKQLQKGLQQCRNWNQNFLI